MAVLCDWFLYIASGGGGAAFLLFLFFIVFLSVSLLYFV